MKSKKAVGEPLHWWGILRPDGTPVTENVLERADWKIDPVADIAGFPAATASLDTYEANAAWHVTHILNERLEALGVPKSQVHKRVLFEIVTTVETHTVPTRKIES